MQTWILTDKHFGLLSSFVGLGFLHCGGYDCQCNPRAVICNRKVIDWHGHIF